MKVRLPKGGASGMPDITKLAQKAQAAQEEMEQASLQLESKEYNATSGGEAVKVTVSGKPEIIKIDIQPEIVDPDDTEMLADLIIAAANEAIKKSQDEKESVMQSISGKMNLPGLF